MVDDYVRAVPQHSRLDADRGDEARVATRDTDVLYGRDRLRQGSRQVVVSGGKLVRELMVAPLEGGVALGDQHALVGVANAFHVDAQPEAVQELRAQLAFLGVHRPPENEAGRW